MKITKRIISLVLASVLLVSLMTAITVNAADNGKVRVTVKNQTYSKAEGAVWDDVLFDEWVALNDSDNMQSVIENTLIEQGVEYSAPYGFFSEINGLSTDKDGNGGWMISLNDWFTSDGASAYSVQNGKLSNNDEITVQFTRSWGADCGSLYGDFNTSLSSVIYSGGALDTCFTSDTHDYTFEIMNDYAEIELIPQAYNKNYQVRAYINEYKPENNADFKRSETVKVKDGDKLYIGVGNSAWPSMNTWAGTADETVYTFTVKKAVLGDANGNGILDIDDVTTIQRYLAEFISFSDAEMARADYDGDNRVSIDDATYVQAALLKLI